MPETNPHDPTDPRRAAPRPGRLRAHEVRVVPGLLVAALLASAVAAAPSEAVRFAPPREVLDLRLAATDPAPQVEVEGWTCESLDGWGPPRPRLEARLAELADPPRLDLEGEVDPDALFRVAAENEHLELLARDLVEGGALGFAEVLALLDPVDLTRALSVDPPAGEARSFRLRGCRTEAEMEEAAEAFRRVAATQLADGRAPEVPPVPPGRTLRVTLTRDLPSGQDYGDAPDPGYPSRGGSGGSRHRDPRRAWLGGGADVEGDSRQVNADADDALVSASPLSFTVTNGRHLGALYANALVDQNQDGDWDDPGEWVLVNRVVRVGPGESEVVVAGDASLGEGTWARLTVTGEPLSGWTGRGAHALGETEDWFLTSAPAPASTPLLLGTPPPTEPPTQPPGGDDPPGPRPPPPATPAPSATPGGSGSTPPTPGATPRPPQRVVTGSGLGRGGYAPGRQGRCIEAAYQRCYSQRCRGAGVGPGAAACEEACRKDAASECDGANQPYPPGARLEDPAGLPDKLCLPARMSYPTHDENKRPIPQPRMWGKPMPELFPPDENVAAMLGDSLDERLATYRQRLRERLDLTLKQGLMDKQGANIDEALKKSAYDFVRWKGEVETHPLRLLHRSGRSNGGVSKREVWKDTGTHTVRLDLEPLLERRAQGAPGRGCCQWVRVERQRVLQYRRKLRLFEFEYDFQVKFLDLARILKWSNTQLNVMMKFLGMTSKSRMRGNRVDLKHGKGVYAGGARRARDRRPSDYKVSMDDSYVWRKLRERGVPIDKLRKPYGMVAEVGGQALNSGAYWATVGGHLFELYKGLDVANASALVGTLAGEVRAPVVGIAKALQESVNEGVATFDGLLAQLVGLEPGDVRYANGVYFTRVKGRSILPLELCYEPSESWVEVVREVPLGEFPCWWTADQVRAGLAGGAGGPCQGRLRSTPRSSTDAPPAGPRQATRRPPAPHLGGPSPADRSPAGPEVDAPVRVEPSVTFWERAKRTLRDFLRAYVAGDLMGAMRQVDEDYPAAGLLRNALLEDFQQETGISVDVQLVRFQVGPRSLEVLLDWRRTATRQGTGTPVVQTGQSSVLISREGRILGVRGALFAGLTDPDYRTQTRAGQLTGTDPVTLFGEDLGAGTGASSSTSGGGSSLAFRTITLPLTAATPNAYVDFEDESFTLFGSPAPLANGFHDLEVEGLRGVSQDYAFFDPATPAAASVVSWCGNNSDFPGGLGQLRAASPVFVPIGAGPANAFLPSNYFSAATQQGNFVVFKVTYTGGGAAATLKIDFLLASTKTVNPSGTKDCT